MPDVSAAEDAGPMPDFRRGAGVIARYAEYLPLTDATREIINADNLAKLPEGAVVMNCARGGHVVDDDLLAALDAGHIAGACLDVFNEEPLPAGHPYWTHPKVRMTPHTASLTDAHSAAEYVAENIRRVERGEAPLNIVDLEAGY